MATVNVSILEILSMPLYPSCSPSFQKIIQILFRARPYDFFFLSGGGGEGVEDLKKNVSKPKQSKWFMLDKLYIMHHFSTRKKIYFFCWWEKKRLALTKSPTPPPLKNQMLCSLYRRLCARSWCTIKNVPFA